MTAIKVDAKPFGMKDKIGYMLGDIGNDAILGLVNSFLMIYYTNVLGIAVQCSRNTIFNFKNY
ncbi:hypothetical protein K9E69_12455 [Staphylococcus pseudintermedius]|nr:hypothetical protein K9E69_12455 [Staphylococcus pseudintermedius]